MPRILAVWLLASMLGAQAAAQLSPPNPGQGPGKPLPPAVQGRPVPIDAFYQAEAEFLEWHRIYWAAPHCSECERYAEVERRRAFDRALDVVARLRDYPYHDSTQLERFALDMHEKYRATPSNSPHETLYDRARRPAFDAAYEAVLREIDRLPYYELDQLESRYSRLYQAAASGSVPEDYYRRVRDLLRRRLGR